MDVFRVHERLLDDYARFTRSFVDIADKRIAATVEEAIDAGLLWPDPWIQLNPNFARGGTPDELVAEGLLHDMAGSRISSSSVAALMSTALAQADAAGPRSAACLPRSAARCAAGSTEATGEGPMLPAASGLGSARM